RRPRSRRRRRQRRRAVHRPRPGHRQGGGGQAPAPGQGRARRPRPLPAGGAAHAAAQARPPAGALGLRPAPRRLPGPVAADPAPVDRTPLTTDNPLYQPGDPVYFRSLTLDRFSLAPAGETFALVYTLTTPLGEERVVGHGASAVVGDDGKSSALPPVLGPDKK